MRSSIGLICVALLCVTSSWAKDEVVNAAILLEDYVEAMDAGDVSAEIAFFSDLQGTVSVIDGQVAVGLTAIRQSLQAQDYGTVMIRSARMRNLGDESVVVFATLGPTTGTREIPGDDTVLLTLVVKNDGGAWQIAHQHVTTIKGGLTKP